MNFINVKSKKKETIPQKVKHFLMPEKDEELFKEVEEYNHYATYSLENSSSRSILNGLKDVTSMMDDPICSSAVKCVMQTAFQSNTEDELFNLITPSTLIEKELNAFHEQIGAKQFLLTTGYNNLIWGQLPWKHIYSEDGILERVMPIPDFTAITPIIISGKTIGFINEDGDFVPSYMYTYSQLEYYKNLGGNNNSRFLTVGGGSNGNDASQFQNEFTYAESYLSSAAKPWRNINIIEDGLLLSRMDQSNYYRIISVNVGGQVYSKSAIQVLNYYRNLFKKVRRVNYDSNGMSARGNGQEFEVIVPKTQNQGVEIQNVGGDVDVKALKDLDTQYQKLFASLQIQPSMIGYSSDTPSSLGDSAAITWDKRFAKVCKTVSYSAYNALRNIDYLHLRSLGYNVLPSDWKYATVSQTLQDDQEKGETLKLAIDNLNNIADSFIKAEVEFNKDYLVKSILGDALGNYGVDVEKLLQKEEDVGAEDTTMITTSLSPLERKSKFQKEILTEDARVMTMTGIFNSKTAEEIVSAFSNIKYSELNIKEKVTPLNLKQVYSSFVVKKDNPIDLTDFVIYEDITCDEMMDLFKGSQDITNGDSMPFKFPIHCPKEMQITAGDLDLSGIGCIDALYVDENNEQYVASKLDLCRYLYNFMNEGFNNYCGTIIRK